MTQIMKLNRPIYKSIRSTVLWHNWIALSMTGWTYLWGNWMNLSMSQLDRPIYDWMDISEKNGWTYLSIYESIWSTYLTQLGDPCNDWRSWMDRYICNTNRWLHLQYKNFALYINDTTGSPLHEINGWPCHWQNWIPRTLLSHLRHRRSALSLIQLGYPIYKTQQLD